MALSDAQEYDPFTAFDDVVAGTTRDPYPGLVAKRRDTPVAQGLDHLARRAARGLRRRARDGSPTATTTARGSCATPRRSPRPATTSPSAW